MRPDSPPLAARLADGFGVDVLASDGPVVLLRGGELLAAGGGGLVRVRAGRLPAPPGGQPAPDAAVAGRPPGGPGLAAAAGVTVTPIPARL